MNPPVKTNIGPLGTTETYYDIEETAINASPSKPSGSPEHWYWYVEIHAIYSRTDALEMIRELRKQPRGKRYAYRLVRVDRVIDTEEDE